MENLKSIETVVEPQDLLFEEMKELKGGKKSKQKNKCKKGGLVLNPSASI